MAIFFFEPPSYEGVLTHCYGGRKYSCLGNPMDRGAWREESMGKQRVRHDWVTNTFTFYPFWKSQLLSPENQDKHTHMPTLCTWLQSSQRSEGSCQSRELQPELVRTRAYGRGMRQRMGAKATNWIICTDDPRKGTAPRTTRYLLSHGCSNKPRKEGLWLSFI